MKGSGRVFGLDMRKTPPDPLLTFDERTELLEATAFMGMEHNIAGLEL